MYQDIRAQKGRFLLRALLWLIFVAQFAQAVSAIYFSAFDRG